MSLAIQIGNVTSAGRKVRRLKTAGAGTLAAFDFKLPSAYPTGVTPTTALPTATSINNLVEKPAATTNAAVTAGATVVSIGVPAGTTVSALGTGTGGAGTYTVSAGALVGSASVPVRFDLSSGGLIVAAALGYLSNGAGAAGTTLMVMSVLFGTIATGLTISGGGGGLVTGTGKSVTLPAGFKVPALNGISARYLIILGIKPASAAAPGAGESLAGWATNTSTAMNWGFYRNAGNTNTFAQVGAAFANFGVLSVAPHRIALEMIKDGAAGTVQANSYIDGQLYLTGTVAAQTAVPQPGSSNPMLGGNGFGSWTSGGEWHSAEIRNLSLDSASAAEIVAADWAAWSSRFS